MKKLLILAAAVLLSGCAQWKAMTPDQKNVFVGSVVAAAVVGYYANDGDTTVIQQAPPCHQHGHKCRD